MKKAFWGFGVLLVYIGTPMVAAKVWKGEDIAREEVRMYRKIYRLSNTISNKAIMNVTTHMRPARDIVEALAGKAWRMYKR